ncbi:NfeD family protein [Anaerobacillus isosaccharinicus]|uniref:Nodulation protein NfeD n=1 Tax=Anaerobacillus isosaccharinicus TaxID=1532552 RepID=A0A1S2LR13_9BACI|nr:NfeD family protein [Anaerobacillus isosaccharinicus]MBA5585535.1 nodulation protein NfeD [Anaerobacillus isosaccharinicus]QOY36151.1 nodulation protein NfeD [Anaerobacillus isosaccharinicus]
MDILNIASVGFFVVFLGTLFLFGELFVKVKGLFAIIGIGIMATYFSFHITAGSGVGLWVALLYICGVALIVIDGKFITDGTVALLGIFLMILGIAIPTPTVVYGFLVAMALLLGAAASLLFMKVFPSRNLWSKMTLKDRLTGDLGYNSLNDSYKDLVGKSAVTATPFRPIGTIEVDGKYFSATSDNQWLDAGAKVEVLSVDGTRIVVRKMENENKNE